MTIYRTSEHFFLLEERKQIMDEGFYFILKIFDKYVMYHCYTKVSYAVTFSPTLAAKLILPPQFYILIYM